MQRWQIFENQCANYLNKKFSDYATFVGQGGSDSTVSDILVETKIGRIFYIEAKEEQAQCGQFVLFPDNNSRKFIYSEFNKNELNHFSQIIIEYLNDNFEKYSNVGTSGISIDMPNGQEIFSSWIKTAYGHKRTHFFITKGFAIIPIEDFEKAFNVTAKYRIKKSGSSPIPHKYVDEVSEYISAHYPNTITAVLDKRLVAQSPSHLAGERFELNGYNYMFSSRNDSRYEVRKLSNTYNANVIFSVNFISDKYKLSDDDFIKELKI